MILWQDRGRVSEASSCSKHPADLEQGCPNRPCGTPHLVHRCWEFSDSAWSGAQHKLLQSQWMLEAKVGLLGHPRQSVMELLKLATGLLVLTLGTAWSRILQPWL